MTSIDSRPATPSAPQINDSATNDSATNTFSTSMLVSGVRCLLTYIVFPWILPALGVAAGVGPAIGLAVGVVAIGFNVASIGRMRASDFRWKRHVMFINAAVIMLLSVLLIVDVADLA